MSRLRREVTSGAGRQAPWGRRSAWRRALVSDRFKSGPGQCGHHAGAVDSFAMAMAVHFICLKIDIALDATTTVASARQDSRCHVLIPCFVPQT